MFIFLPPGMPPSAPTDGWIAGAMAGRLPDTFWATDLPPPRGLGRTIFFVPPFRLPAGGVTGARPLPPLPMPPPVGSGLPVWADPCPACDAPFR
jgi:hypothetical protein